MRTDFAVIAAFVHKGSKVLDVGCGDGSLLELLQNQRQIIGRGIELSQRGVEQCLNRGLSVIQGDADRDLVSYPDQGFDYVILSQTLQATHNPRQVVEQLLRIGRQAIISIPNFGYWRVRLSLLMRGRMPITKELPYTWYNTPNIHFCTIADFVDLVHDLDAEITGAVALKRTGAPLKFTLPWCIWNIFGQQAVFLLRPKKA